jgi:hypothetical protein
VSNEEIERRLQVTKDLLEEEEKNPYPMTALEVIARIRAARAEKEGPKQCQCSNCSCGKKNDAEPV